MAEAARDLLDRINYEYALSSLGLRRYVPYRRQTSRAGIADLSDHPHTAMMRVWAGMQTGARYAIANNAHQALFGALMPYRLPGRVAALAASTDRSLFVRIGRGPRSSAELYAGGNGYLLSAGGTGRRGRSQIVARPITLMLADGAVNAGQLFSIGGGGDYQDWKNTGVLPGLGIAAGSVHVPSGRTPMAAQGAWRVYRDAATDTTIEIGAAGDPGGDAAENVGVLYVRDRDELAALKMTASDLAGWLAAQNPSEAIVSINGVMQDRDLTGWPRLSGRVDDP